jgi:pimeloyl-ACP methyl ester carboxylesterase
MTDTQKLLPAPEYIDIDDYVVKVRRVVRSGMQRIVLVHGIGVSSRYFVPLAEELATTYDVTILDLPGYGTAPDPKRTLSIPELGEVVAGYVRHTGLAPAMLVGHSMGCQIVAHTARQSPELCNGLILIGPTVNKWERSRRMQAWRLLQDVFREPLRVCLLVLGDYLRMGVGRYLRTSRSMIADKIEDTLAGCDLATLIVRGEKDPIVPAKWAHVLAGQLIDAHVLEVADAPHVVQYKQPRGLARELRQYIDVSTKK